MYRNKQENEALKFKASVLYIKHGLSAKQISATLNISMPTLQKWANGGKWQDLRPDLEVLKEYKAADLYINAALNTGEIAMKLSIQESLVNLWVFTNGWDAARQLTQAHSDYTDIINGFCSLYAKMFPNHYTEIEVVKIDYLRTVRKLKI